MGLGCLLSGARGSSTAPTESRVPVTLQFSALTGATSFIDQITEQGFQVSGPGFWYNNPGYGNPAPSIWLYRFMRFPEITGDLTISAVGGGPFTFTSLDLSPIQPTSCTLTGSKSGQPAFDQTGTAPHVNGQLFITVQSDHPETLVDTFVIHVIEPFAQCCDTFTYVDNISLVKR
jgi:hypothetical protein